MAGPRSTGGAAGGRHRRCRGSTAARRALCSSSGSHPTTCCRGRGPGGVAFRRQGRVVRLAHEARVLRLAVAKGPQHPDAAVVSLEEGKPLPHGRRGRGRVHLAVLQLPVVHLAGPDEAEDHEEDGADDTQHHIARHLGRHAVQVLAGAGSCVPPSRRGRRGRPPLRQQGAAQGRAIPPVVLRGRREQALRVGVRGLMSVVRGALLGRGVELAVEQQPRLAGPQGFCEKAHAQHWGLGNRASGRLGGGAQECGCPRNAVLLTR